MSRILFRSKGDEAYLSGCERAYGASIAADLTLSTIGDFDPEWLLPIIPENSYLQSRINFHRAFQTWFSVGHNAFVDGIDHPFSIKLNTALALGNDPLKLLARLHGQCEIHCFVRGENRNWLAKIIENGRGGNWEGEWRNGILRSGVGWEDVVSLLRKDSLSPVVTSYSVCDGFPNKSCSTFSCDCQKDCRCWMLLSDEDQWQYGLQWLLSPENSCLEIRPDDWDSFRFHNGHTGMDLYRLATGKERWP